MIKIGPLSTNNDNVNPDDLATVEQPKSIIDSSNHNSNNNNATSTSKTEFPAKNLSQEVKEITVSTTNLHTFSLTRNNNNNKSGMSKFYFCFKKHFNPNGRT